MVLTAAVLTADVLVAAVLVAAVLVAHMACGNLGAFEVLEAVGAAAGIKVSFFQCHDEGTCSTASAKTIYGLHGLHS